VQGKTANVAMTSGSACYIPRGGTDCIPIAAETQIPLGSTVDAEHGQVAVTTSDGTFVFYDGSFVVSQTGPNGVRVPSARAVAAATLTDIKLVGGNVAQCTASLRGESTSSALLSLIRGGSADKPKKPVRRLFGKGKGRFRTRGSFASATVRGTLWLTQDFCNGTLVRVLEGVIEVRDLVLKKTVTVKAGKSYFAEKTPRAAQKAKPKPRPKQKPRPKKKR
jgi:hypothetical protein